MKKFIKRYKIDNEWFHDVECFECNKIYTMKGRRFEKKGTCKECFVKKQLKKENTTRQILDKIDTTKYTINQLVEMTGLNANTIKSYVHRAKVEFIREIGGRGKNSTKNNRVPFSQILSQKNIFVKNILEKNALKNIDQDIQNEDIQNEDIQDDVIDFIQDPNIEFKPNGEIVFKPKPDSKAEKLKTLTRGEWIMAIRQAINDSQDREETQYLLQHLSIGSRPKRMPWDERCEYYNAKLEKVWNQAI